MKEWKIGDEVQISNDLLHRFGHKGVVVDKGIRGGLYVLFPDGETEYHPWGYDIVRAYREQPNQEGMER